MEERVRTDVRFLCGGILALKGVKVDTIKKLMGKKYPDELMLDTTNYLAGLLMTLEDNVEDPSEDYKNPHPIKVLPTMESIQQTFWRTMLGACMVEKCVPMAGETGKEVEKERAQDVNNGNEHPTGPSQQAKIEDTARDKEQKYYAPLRTADWSCSTTSPTTDFTSMRRLFPSDLYTIQAWLPIMWQILRFGVLSGIEDVSFTTIIGRRFIIGESGHWGLAPGECDVGDELWVLKGGRVAFVLRKDGERDGKTSQRIVGDCFIHGIIDREVVGGLDFGAIERVDWEDVFLV